MPTMYDYSRTFFDRYYRPDNTILFVAGDVEPGAVLALAEKYYGEWEPGYVEPPVPLEPEQQQERRIDVSYDGQTLPVLWVAYKIAAFDPADRIAVAADLLAELAFGETSAAYRRLVLEKQVAVDTEGGIQYPVGNLFDYNGPTLMVTRILHKPEYSAEKTLETYDEVIGEVQEQGVSEDELEQVKVKFRSDYFSMLEGGMGGYMPRYGLMHLLACFALFDGEPGLVNTILDGFQKVTRARLQTAAQKFLVPSNRSIVLRQPVQKGTA